MKKSRIIACLICLVMLIASGFALAIPSRAADSDWIDAGNSSNSYAYSMAIIGDTQTLSISDAENYGIEGYVPRVNQIYDWIVANKGEDAKNIQLVMGLGDIVETWQSPQDWNDEKYSQYWDIHNLEWDLNKTQIKKLADADIPFTLVRGNHDSDKAFAEEIGSFSAYTEQLNKMGGFYTDASGNIKYDTSYIKIELGSEENPTKWLVIQLDWMVTTAELDWAANLIKTNPDHQVILTMHNYLYNDASVDGKTGSANTAKPNPSWDYSIDPTADDLDPNLVFNPDGIWHRLVSKHENIKLVISGHVPNSGIQNSQLIGDNGNTVTQLLVDPQSMDLESENSGGCGMVCMLYFREDGTLVEDNFVGNGNWDGNTVDVEWYSTIKDKFYKASNQFTLDLNFYSDGISTENYGVIHKDFASADVTQNAELVEKYPFVVFAHDVDIDEYFFLGAYENWSTSEGGGAYPSLTQFSGKSGIEGVILLRRDFDNANDTSYSNFGNSGIKVNLDLNGYTFTMSANISLFQTNLKRSVKTYIHVYGKENSAILNGSAYSSIITLGVASANANGAEFTYNFDGVKIGYSKGAATAKLVAQTFDGSAGSGTYVNQNLIFEDCTFDLITNKPDVAITMFLLNETESETVGRAMANVEINGGEIIADDLSEITLVSKNANDRFSYNPNEIGEYVTYNLSEESTSPETHKSALNKTLELVTLGDGSYTFERSMSAESGSLGTIDVWLIGGQSNAAGYGSDGLTDGKFDSRYQNGFDNILYYGAADNNKKSEFVPLTEGLGNSSTSVGAEVGIAKMLGDSDTMNAVIKLGRGSSYLYPDTAGSASVSYGTWTSPTYLKDNKIGTSGTNVGALYNDFIATVAEAIDLLEMQGYTPVIRGMWWMQGEAECSSEELANAYSELLTNFINDVRADIEENTGIESSNMPFVCGNIYRNMSKDANGNYIYSQPAYLSLINETQANVAKKLENIYTVATAGLPQKDNWHFTADAQQYLGEQFVKTVVYSEGNYSAMLDAVGAEGSGFGSYSVGDTVTVTVTGRDGYVINKVYYTVSGQSAEELDVAEGACTYTFTMPASDVTFTVEADDTEAEETKYGNIPSRFTDENTYPFILFKKGEFFKAYEDWNSILNTGNQIFLTDAEDSREATLLLRKSYDTSNLTASSQNLYTIEGHISFDLNGFTLTRGSYHLFQAMAKKSTAKAVPTSFTIYNGTILAGTNAPFVINTNGEAGADDNFYFIFNGVNFGFAKGTTSARLVFETYSNGTYDTLITAVFNDCTFDAKTNAPDKALCLFDLDEETGSLKSADVKVMGGSMVIGDISTSPIYALGASDKFAFGKGERDTYTTLNLSASTTVDGLYNSTEEGTYLKFGTGTPEADGTYTYSFDTVSVEQTDNYGVIDTAQYPKETYPFVLFTKQSDGTYTFKSAYTCYFEFLLDLKLNPLTVEAVLYLRDDYTVSTTFDDGTQKDNKTFIYNGTTYYNVDRNLNCLEAALTIDLNGKTLTRNNAHSLQMMGNGNDVSITVKNGYLHTASGTMIPFNNTGASPETTTLNFEGVTFTTANLQYPFIDAYTGGSAGTTTNASITFTDCVFDISNLSRTSTSKACLLDLKDDNDWVNIDITFIGGEFISGDAGFSNVNLYTLNDGNDSVKFNKDIYGNYACFEVKKETSAPAYSFISGEEGTQNLSLFATFSIFEDATSTKTHNVYFLDESTSVSEHTNLPESLTEYTFLVFNEEKTAFVGYNTWYEIWANIWTLRKADNLVVVLLEDYDTDNCTANSQDIFSAKNMVIDLNGNTLTRGSHHIFQLFEKGTNATYSPDITVKNGTLYSKKNYASIMYFNSSMTASGVNLNFDFTFENVTFTSSDEYIGRLVAETHATNAVNGISTNITFNDCDFIVKNYIDSMFTLNESSGKHATNVIINGGSITFNKNVPIALLNSNDKLTFGKYNGSYTTLSAKNEVSAPTESFITEDGVECAFVKAAEIGDNVNYTLYPCVMIGYKVKTSVTLWSNFVFNIYIPAANLNSFTLNEKAYKYTVINIDGVDYYHVPVNLASDEALSDITLKVTLNSGDTTVDGNWTLNVLNYAKAVINGNYNDVTKTLMKDMLVYASAAHTYFNNPLEEEKTAIISELLADYSAQMPTGVSKEPENATYFTKAEINLGEVPSFRFYLSDSYSASDFTFKVGAKNVDAVAVDENDDGADDYIEVVMYAYMMLDDVSYTVTNKETSTTVTESYNLYAYCDYVNGFTGDLADENLVAIVEGLMKYASSAKSYRESVINSES